MSTVRVEAGDCRDVIKTLADCSVDSVVTDPPYALVSIQKRFGKPGSAPAKGDVYLRASAGFMGQQWDTGETAFDAGFWREVLRVLKPGGHLLAFSGTRTYHRMACAIEDAGFEIRDMLAWLYGTGFPKSHDLAKAFDRAAGIDVQAAGWQPTTPAAVEWQGWGTALKPALEPICLARKPLEGTVAANVLAHGTGAINVDACRIDAEQRPLIQSDRRLEGVVYRPGLSGSKHVGQTTVGRWPANVVLSWPEDEYVLRPDVTAEQKAELYRWLSENT